MNSIESMPWRTREPPNAGLPTWSRVQETKAVGGKCRPAISPGAPAPSVFFWPAGRCHMHDVVEIVTTGRRVRRARILRRYLFSSATRWMWRHYLGQRSLIAHASRQADGWSSSSQWRALSAIRESMGWLPIRGLCAGWQLSGSEVICDHVDKDIRRPCAHRCGLMSSRGHRRCQERQDARSPSVNRRRSASVCSRGRRSGRWISCSSSRSSSARERPTANAGIATRKVCRIGNDVRRRSGSAPTPVQTSPVIVVDRGSAVDAQPEYRYRREGSKSACSAQWFQDQVMPPAAAGCGASVR